MTGLELGHAVFEAFRAPRSGDFSSTRVYGYRQVAAVADAQVLARFDGGAPAVLEKRLGAGRVLMWSSTLDQSWTDLPMKPCSCRSCTARPLTWPHTCRRSRR